MDSTFDAIPTAVFVWREDGTILDLNGAAAALVGRDRDELVGSSYWSLTSPGQKQREIAAARRREAPFDKEFLGRDGAVITARVVAFGPAPGEGDDAHLCVLTGAAQGPTLRDVESALRRQNRLLLRLAQSEEIDAGDLERALPLVTEAASEGLACDRASVWMYNDDKTAIVCTDLFVAASGEHGTESELTAHDYPAYFAALAENRTIAASDAVSDPATCEFTDIYLKPLDVGALIDAPIRLGGEVRGILCCEWHGGARPFTQDEINFAATIADVLSRALTAADRRIAEEALEGARAALERHSLDLEAQVVARTEELARLDEENQGLIEQLRRSVEVLSTPVIEVWRDVLAVPVIGNIDPEQSGRMTSRLLDEITRTRARYVILELTGLSHCDPRTAGAFVRMARAVELLGAECVLSGLQPDAARTIVEHGIDLSRLRTRRTLQQALQELLAASGVDVRARR